MTLRHVTDTLLNADGTAKQSATVSFRLIRPSYTGSAAYLTTTTTVTTNTSGAYDAVLWCDEEGVSATQYQATYPDGTTITFDLPVGDGTPIAMATLRTASPAVPAVNLATLLEAISLLNLSDTPDTYAGQGGKVVAVKSDVSGVEFVTPSSGVTDHGALTGLADDDHVQYHTDARGDLRYQPLDSDLTAIAALATTAFGRALLVLADAAALRTAGGLGTAALADTGTGAANVPTITQADARYWQLSTDLATQSEFDVFAGLVTSALAGKQPIDATLSALAAFNTNGLLTQTAADTFTGRTITGTASRLAVTNGNGVSGNPTLDIDSGYVGQASITTLGTIGTGTWQATKIGLAYGGTNADLSGTSGYLKQATSGANVVPVSTIPYGDLSYSGLTTGQVWRATGAAAAAFGALDLANTNAVTGLLAPANGGTGVNNAGTLTNATNTTITGGGTLALGGFTLTVPATGTAALLGTANVFTAAQTVNGANLGIAITGAASGGTPSIVASSPAQVASATAGTPLQITASPAIAGSSNAGAAVGGNVTITAGAAARLTSGNAAGGDINLVPGAGIGSGLGGRVIIPTGSALAPSLTFTANQNEGFARVSGVATIYGGIVAFRVTSNAIYMNTSATLGWNAGDANSGVQDTAIWRNSAGIIEVNTGTAGQWGALKAGTRDSGTTTITDGLTLGHQSTGTPAAGLGIGIALNINSSTTADQNAARLTAEWVVATHASRTARATLNVYDTASREGLRVQASGSAAMIGFLGAAALVRQTVAADATDLATAITLVNDIKAKLGQSAGFGLFAN